MVLTRDGIFARYSNHVTHVGYGFSFSFVRVIQSIVKFEYYTEKSWANTGRGVGDHTSDTL